MKLLLLSLSVALCGLLPPQDNTEAKKKRLGELVKQMGQVQKEVGKLIEELSGGDPEKAQTIMREAMEKYAPEMAAGMASALQAANERNASATLKSLAAAEADFRANDRDENHVNDFWVADVSGLYRVDAGQGPLRLIELAAATADAKPCVPLDKAGTLPRAAKEHASKLAIAGKPSPKAGYWFSVIEKYQDEKGASVKYDDGNGRNPSMFGLCTYPTEYGKTGKMTFILNEENVVWKKDIGGKPPEVFPADPEKAGWTRIY
jgi:hypothetical protein